MILLALACAVEITGSVTEAAALPSNSAPGSSAAAKPIVGATLHADGCDAVTDAHGAFRTRCPRARYSFLVSHPDYLDRAVDIDATGMSAPPFLTTLTGYPTAPGLYVAAGTDFTPLARAPLVHTVVTGDSPEEKWCAEVPAVTTPTVVSAGSVRLLDVHDRDWRVYRLDAGGCAYRMTPGEASFWKFAAERVEESGRTPVSPGRDWVRLDLPAGDYAIVEWYDGFLVPEGNGVAGWRVRAG